MKRLALVGLVALGLCACDTEVPGLTCKANSDCATGVCDQGLCIEQRCVPSCDAYQICLETTCTASFESLSIDSPSANVELAPPFPVTVSVARRSSATNEPPASIVLIARPDVGAPQSFTLRRVEGALSYRGDVDPAGLGRFTLTAESAELDLTSAPVKVSIQAGTCPQECSADQYCSAGACKPAFLSIELVEPSTGTVCEAPVPVRVRLHRAPGLSQPFPASVTLEASRSGATLPALTLQPLPTFAGDYSGALSPDRGGGWTLLARYQAFESKPVSITVPNCAHACPLLQDCVDEQCVEAYTGIRFVQPTEALRVRDSVAITVALDKRAGSENGATPTVTVSAAPANGEIESTVKLARQGDGTYAGTLSLAEAKTYTLTATTDALAQASATVNVVVDRTGPLFTIEVPKPTRQPHERDPQSPDAWRRDERPAIVIRSADEHLVPTTVRTSVRDTSGLSTQMVPSSCFDTSESGFCRTLHLELFRPKLSFNAFRGTFQISVTGQDDLGNEATQTAEIPVTRWRWAVDLNAGPIRTAPAIGASGNIYVGSSNWPGKAFAITPDGTIKWSFPTDGPIESSLVVADVNGTETAFVAGTKAGVGAIWGLTDIAHHPNLAPLCTDGTEAIGSLAATSVALDGEAQPLTTAFVAFRQTTGSVIYAVRPQASVKCISAPTTAAVSPASGFAIREQKHVYFGDEEGHLQSFELTATGLLPRWSRLVGNGNQPTNPIITESGVACGGGGSGVGALFRVPFAGDGMTVAATDSSAWNAIAVLDETDTRIVAGSSKGGVYVLDEEFQATEPTVTQPPSWMLAGALKAAPAFGSGGELYLASTDKKLYVRDLSGAPLWDAELGAGSTSSPALDCSREWPSYLAPDLGVVYLGADDGKLYAFVTDSSGIDRNSPWPKFHRDPRNSSDASVDLSAFKCE